MYAEDLKYIDGNTNDSGDFFQEYFGPAESADVIETPVKEYAPMEEKELMFEEIVTTDSSAYTKDGETVTIPAGEDEPKKNNIGLYIVIGIVAVLLLNGK